MPLEVHLTDGFHNIREGVLLHSFPILGSQGGFTVLFWFKLSGDMHPGHRLLLCPPGNTFILLMCDILLMSDFRKIFGTLKWLYLGVLPLKWPIQKIPKLSMFHSASGFHQVEKSQPGNMYQDENPFQYAPNQGKPEVFDILTFSHCINFVSCIYVLISCFLKWQHYFRQFPLPLTLSGKGKIPHYDRGKKIGQRDLIANEAVDAGDLGGEACSGFQQ